MSRFRQETEKQRWIKEISNSKETCGKIKRWERVDCSSSTQSLGYKKRRVGKRIAERRFGTVWKVLNASERPDFTGRTVENRSGVPCYGATRLCFRVADTGEQTGGKNPEARKGLRKH